MTQFDVFAQGFGKQRAFPYIVALQSDILSPLKTIIVAPLRRFSAMPTVSRLNPVLVVNDEGFMLAVAEMFPAPAHLLGRPVANLASERDRIIAAIDMLFTGI